MMTSGERQERQEKKDRHTRKAREVSSGQEYDAGGERQKKKGRHTRKGRGAKSRKRVSAVARAEAKIIAAIKVSSGNWLKWNVIRSGSWLWHLRVAEGDHLSERSE